MGPLGVVVQRSQTESFGNHSDPHRVVRMLSERRDGRTHPFVERKSTQESVKFRFAAGAVEAEDRRAAGADGDVPQPDEVPLARQRLCRSSFCPRAASISDSGTPSGIFSSNCTRNSIIDCTLLLVHTRLGCHLDAVSSHCSMNRPGGIAALAEGPTVISCEILAQRVTPPVTESR